MADEPKFVGTPKKATTHVNQNEGLIFEKSSPGKKAYRMAELDVPAVDAAALLGASVRAGLREAAKVCWDAKKGDDARQPERGVDL